MGKPGKPGALLVAHLHPVGTNPVLFFNCIIIVISIVMQQRLGASVMNKVVVCRVQ